MSTGTQETAVCCLYTLNVIFRPHNITFVGYITPPNLNLITITAQYKQGAAEWLQNWNISLSTQYYHFWIWIP
jgi:hypothetical protein